MNSARSAFLLGLALVSLAPLSARAAEQKHLAVLEFEIAPGLKIDRVVFSDLARSAVNRRAPDLFVMTRESTEALLQANGKTVADCTGECEVETGRKLGADYIVSGRIAQVGKHLFLTMRLFSTFDGRLLQSADARGTNIDELVDQADAALVTLVSPLGAAPTAKRSSNAAKRSATVASEGAGSEGHIGGAAQDVAVGDDAEVVVQFASEPPGAVVLLDGAVLCQATPCSKLVAKGPHDVSLQREGYEPQTAQLAAKDGAKVQVTLVRISARVSVETEPAGIAISIDGKEAGASPLAWRELKAGEHKVVIDDPCWQSDGERVVLKKGEDRPLRIVAKPRLAGLKVTAEDEKGNALEARALLDGKELGKVPGTFKVPLCTKSVEVTTSDSSQAVELKLEEGKVAQKRVVLSTRAAAASPGKGRIEPKSGLEFVNLPGGALEGGNFAGTRVAPFALGRTATTVAAYGKCVAAGACTEPQTGAACNWKTRRENHPINCVDWNQATAFCGWIGGRLPKSEEREWAASGGEGREYPWGNQPPSNQLCWDGEGSDLGKGNRKTTCPVGAYPAGRSKQGLLDLAGNVWEWLDTDYNGGKELRGGSWGGGYPSYFRVSDRLYDDPSLRYASLGFRCAQ